MRRFLVRKFVVSKTSFPSDEVGIEAPSELAYSLLLLIILIVLSVYPANEVL